MGDITRSVWGCGSSVAAAIHPTSVGGYSTVINASKVLHMFKNRAHKRKYMGLVHRTTGEYWWILGCESSQVTEPKKAVGE